MEYKWLGNFTVFWVIRNEENYFNTAFNAPKIWQILRDLNINSSKTINTFEAVTDPNQILNYFSSTLQTDSNGNNKVIIKFYFRLVSVEEVSSVLNSFKWILRRWQYFQYNVKIL